MLSLVKKPFAPIFDEFIKTIETDCFICSPYITSEPVKTLVKTINNLKRRKIKIEILTDISFQNLVQGGTDISALLHFFDTHHQISITYLPKLHAKVYIANKSMAIVSSANFTHNGAMVNFEYGLKITDHATILKICQDMHEYSVLGSNIDKSELKQIQTQVIDIRKTIQTEQKNINQTIRLYSKKQQREIENNLIRARVKHRNQNTIFSETLLYLLSQNPSTTGELHKEISAIHPDLCDDVDRIIDGEHFGKLWKHKVRNAQQHLKKSGAIHYDKTTKLWKTTQK